MTKLIIALAEEIGNPNLIYRTRAGDGLLFGPRVLKSYYPCRWRHFKRIFRYRKQFSNNTSTLLEAISQARASVKTATLRLSLAG